MVILLQDGTKRFSHLQCEIDGISQKMLTQTLRGLKRDGLVTRKVYASVPPKVEYELTLLAHTLKDMLYAIKTWSEANIEACLALRIATTCVTEFKLKQVGDSPT